MTATGDTYQGTWDQDSVTSTRQDGSVQSLVPVGHGPGTGVGVTPNTGGEQEDGEVGKVSREVISEERL